MPKIFIIRCVRFRHSRLINFATDCYHVHNSRQGIVFWDRSPQSTITAIFVNYFSIVCHCLLLGLVVVCSLSGILTEHFYAFVICIISAAFPTSHFFLDLTNLISLSRMKSVEDAVEVSKSVEWCCAVWPSKSISKSPRRKIFYSN